MFGQPIHIRLASVIIGCRLIGQPHFLSTSTDLISALMKVGSMRFHWSNEGNNIRKLLSEIFSSTFVKWVWWINISNSSVQDWTLCRLLIARRSHIFVWNKVPYWLTFPGMIRVSNTSPALVKSLATLISSSKDCLFRSQCVLYRSNAHVLSSGKIVQWWSWTAEDCLQRGVWIRLEFGDTFL